MTPFQQIVRSHPAIQIPDPGQRHTGSRTAPASGTGRGASWGADVVDLIQADHRRIRRLHTVLCQALHDASAPSPGWRIGPVWQRLAEVLELHFAAEEEICHLYLLGISAIADQQVLDAIADHDDIRAAMAEARLQPAGSALWWRAVTSVLSGSAGHLDREEQGILPEARQWTTAQRHVLGRQWSVFIAARRRDAVPQRYGDQPVSVLRSSAAKLQHAFPRPREDRP